jgi:DNA repair exonuclease SbcCD ATPase subunit
MVETYKLDIPYIKYIYHIADIHIRLNERIEEYTEVFRELYKSIEESSEDSRKESIIVMAGDIFDAKTNLKSESLELFDILMELLKLMPIIIIAGNHDGNMTNTKYKDALYYVTKVYERLYEINHMNMNRLYYLDKTGFYETENIIIGVKHIFDTSNIVPNINKIQTNKIKICIHHGTISGSKTDIGQVLESDDTIKMFSGYNFVLLGDIHKRQFFGDNTIAYPGSLIQQNYGESLEKHGYLIWDIIEYNFYEMNIKNNYGFVTLNIVKNKIKELYEDILISEEYPKNLNIRIRYENCTAEYLSKLRKELETKYTIIKYVEENRLSKINQMEKYMNMKGNKRFEKLIKKYMKDNKISETYYEIIMKELGEILKDSKTEHVVYSIKKLYISNILCYGEYNEIDFSKYGDSIGIFSKNYTGKSTIIDCICECLFDTNLKGISKKDILRNGCKKGYIKLLIDINGKEYTIEKIYSARPKVNLYINNELMNDDTTVKTMKIMREQIGSIEKFRQTDCISQNDNNGIADMTKEQRKRFLKEILDLKDYSDKSKKMREKLLSIKNEITMIEKINDKNSKELTSIDNKELPNIIETITTLEVEREQLRSEIIYNDFKEVINKSKQAIDIQIADNNDMIETYRLDIKELRLHNDKLELDKSDYEEICDITLQIELLRKAKHNIREYDLGILDVYRDKLKAYDEKKKLVNQLTEELTLLINDIDGNQNIVNSEIEQEHRRFLDEINKKKLELVDLIKPLREVITIEPTIKEQYQELEVQIKAYNQRQDKLEELNKEIHWMKILKDKYEKYEVYLKRKEDIDKIEYNEDCTVCVKNNKETIHMKHDIITKLEELWLEEFSNIDKIRRDYKDRMYKREMLEKENKKVNIEDLMSNSKKMKEKLEQFHMNQLNEKHNKEIQKKNEEYKSEINRLHNMKDEKYETYKMQLDTTLKLIEQSNQRRKVISKELDTINILKLEKELGEMKIIVDEINQNKALIEENRIIDGKLILLQKYQNIIEQQKSNERLICEKENQINILLNQNQAIIKAYEIYNNNQRINIRLSEIDKQYMELIRRKINIERDMEVSNRLKDEIIKNNELLMKLYEEKDRYEILERIFDKNGLSEYIMRTAYNDISESINRLTEKVCGYHFKIDDNTNFMIERDNKEYYIENGSGAEKLILNIAFRMTVSNIKCISRSDMMIIDESFISFDKDNRNKIEDIIEMILTKYRRVLVISHMEELQDIIRERIEIRSERGVSRIL